MKKGISIIVLVAATVAAHAQAQTLVDDFSASMPNYVLPTEPDYGVNGASVSGPLFDYRKGSASDYIGNGTDLFVISATGNGTLTAAGAGTAGGTLQLSYSNYAAVDLSGIASFTLHVSALTAPITGYFSSYSDHYANYSYGHLNITSVGDTTVYLNDYVGGDPFVAALDNDITFSMNVGAGQSVSITKITANAVPEPTSIAAMGFGLALFARRRRQKAA
jgi:hypothetical protein